MSGSSSRDFFISNLHFDDTSSQSDAFKVLILFSAKIHTTSPRPAEPRDSQQCHFSMKCSIQLSLDKCPIDHLHYPCRSRLEHLCASVGGRGFSSQPLSVRNIIHPRLRLSTIQYRVTHQELQAVLPSIRDHPQGHASPEQQSSAKFGAIGFSKAFTPSAPHPTSTSQI